MTWGDRVWVAGVVVFLALLLVTAGWTAGWR
jgi:hypothetical protein